MSQHPAPTTLFDLLSINLVLRQTAPYLPLPARLALSSTNRQFQALITTNSEAWRYLDLSRVKAAMIDTSPIDSGGISWRAERMDEALTEDDFYSGPLRGIFFKLQTKGVLGFVHILVLDGLAVPADLVREIVAEERFDVKMLSLRECKHLNHTKLQQVLRYAVRPGRPDDMPRLRGLYVFGHKESPQSSTTKDTQSTGASTQPATGILASEGAQIGAEWNSRSSNTLNHILPNDDQQRWYDRSGRVITRPTTEWADTLYACQGHIAFDSVLCRGPRHDITLTTGKAYLPPALANVALGPQSCETCNNSPEGPAVFGQTSEETLTLLAPPPLHSATVRAAQKPQGIPSTDPNSNTTFPPLFARCEACLRDRWCERCNRWWCEDCYHEPVSRTADVAASQTPAAVPTAQLPQAHVQSVEWAGPAPGGPAGQQVKMGVHRDCYGCGKTCEACRDRYMRTCRFCRAEYCVVDNEGSSETECDWCHQGGRRTRELF